MDHPSTFLTAAELQSALAGMNPSTLTDVSLVEQGTSSMLLMTHSVRSLKSASDLASSADDLNLLVERNVFRQHIWLDYQPDTGRLVTKKIFIRPASLRPHEADKIIEECDIMSALSLAWYLQHRESANDKTEITPLSSFRQITDPHRIIASLGILESHSIEAFLDSYDVSDRSIRRIVEILSQPSNDLFTSSQSSREIPPGVLDSMDDRGDFPFLYRISNERHILFPNPTLLVNPTEDDIVEQPTVAEWLYNAHIETARSLILQLENEDSTHLDYQGILATFEQHSSLQSEEAWPGIQSFIEATQKLHDLVEILRRLRIESAFTLAYSEMLQALNMQLRPVHISVETLNPPPFLLRRMNNAETVFRRFVDKAKKDPEVMVHQGQAGNYFFLFKSNLVQAFIEHRQQRTLLHLMAKQNDIANGIYDFVSSSPSLNDAAKRLQEELIMAIRRWEQDRQREIEKRERAKTSFFRRIFDWLLSLFGMLPASLPADDVPAQTQTTSQAQVARRHRPSAPPDRRRLIPSKIEKAISFVERNQDGLIWVDDVVSSLASATMNLEAVSDILFYDKEQRFKEIRPLSKIRRLFIRMEMLENPEWVKETIHRLETTARMPQHLALLDYLKKGDD